MRFAIKKFHLIFNNCLPHVIHVAFLLLASKIIFLLLFFYIYYNKKIYRYCSFAARRRRVSHTRGGKLKHEKSFTYINGRIVLLSYLLTNKQMHLAAWRDIAKQNHEFIETEKMCYHYFLVLGISWFFHFPI